MNGSPPAFLEAKGLRVRRGGVEVLDVPALALARGSCLSLVGPNGAGKTTLLLALAGLMDVAAGTLFLDGKPVTTGADRRAFRRRVSMVFQQPLLFDTTVAGNIAAGLRMRRLPRAQVRRRVETCADRFGIAGLLDRAARRLSAGEAQRTSLARAFVLEPEVLFLDEPFTALDPPTRSALAADLRRVQQESGTTALLSTHEPIDGVRLADAMAVMNAGRIVQLGPPAEVMSRPVDALVAAFLGVETVLPGVVTAMDRGLLEVDVGGCSVRAVGEIPIGERVLICLRPEQVVIALQREERTSLRNAFRGRITGVVPNGTGVRIEVDCGFPLVASVSHPAREELALGVGREVIASFKATAVHLLRR